MYEESYVPERLPGGGGFSIKNMSLKALYHENIIGHNIWTKSNMDLPLFRYIGCKITAYQSLNIDYIISYSNSWPLNSSLLMYNSMQPNIHLLQKNRLVIPSKNTVKWKKPYKRFFIRPPAQMTNKWYFQKQLVNTPLLMLRTTAFSLDHFYIGNRMLSTNITIPSLNTNVFQNRHFGTTTNQYWSRKLGTITYYLYTTHTTYTTINDIKICDLICLGNTKNNVRGKSYADINSTYDQTKKTQYQSPTNWGNPFYTDYLQGNDPIIQSSATWSTVMNNFTAMTDTIGTKLNQYQWTEAEPIFEVRYNPYKDNGYQNKCYFLGVKADGVGWDPPSREELTNENLPLYILLFGFSDFQKKQAIIKHIDEDYVFTIQTPSTSATPHNIQTLCPISESFIEGESPYEGKYNSIDGDRWFPTFQFQQEKYNDICLCGPGTAKINDTDTVEAKIKYDFIFKWGGELPQMLENTDPADQAYYVVPNNELQGPSLQDPETRPETLLYRFDERRGQITATAAKRIKKDYETETYAFSPTDSKWAETTLLQKTQETSSSEEEEEENLYLKLQQQRLKQRKLKQRILLTLQQLQSLE